ncbi:MAG: RecQ family ATP-dependent DNA helicase, partial [Alphaproteobacteria bacterium]
MSSLTAARAVLREVFGYEAFRPGQAEIIGSVLSGRNTLAVLPTGGGKSLCYQIPALLNEGVALVISPLISLMRDQVAALEAAGVAAASLSSGNAPEDNRRILERLENADLKLLFLSPERLLGGGMIERLRHMRISLIAVDEAHCMSQWGHDFRKDYLELARLPGLFPGTPLLALTATADEATRGDIVARLFRGEAETFVSGFDRPNIRLGVTPKRDARRQVLEFVRSHEGESGIVYCLSRRGVEEMADFLQRQNIRALPYHAGMEQGKRRAHQDRFVQEDGIVIVATIAFGMGIDKPDVRFVLHADLPASVENYYQELGRAGRDGAPAEALMLYGLNDIRQRRRMIHLSEKPEETKRVDRSRLDALLAICEATGCRRRTLLAWFGESIDPCGNCDLCLDPVAVTDGTVEAQKVLSAVYRTGQRFGAA